MSELTRERSTPTDDGTDPSTQNGEPYPVRTERTTNIIAIGDRGGTAYVEMDINNDRLRDLLCAAFEGGSNYWILPGSWSRGAPARRPPYANSERTISAEERQLRADVEHYLISQWQAIMAPVSLEHAPVPRLGVRAPEEAFVTDTGSNWGPGDWHYTLPTTGGSICFRDAEAPATRQCVDDQGRYVLDGYALWRGIEVLQRDYPDHLHDYLEEEGDALTGDTYLQCALFGEVVYA